MGIGAARVQIATAELEDLPQGAVFQELLGPHGRRKETVLEGHLRGAPIAGQGRSDLFRFGPGGHQRLFAINVLAVPQGGKQRLLVELIGRANVHNIHRRILGDQPVIGARHLGAEHLPGFFRRLRPAGDDVGDSRLQRWRIAEKRQCRVAIGVHFPDESAAQNAHVVNFHEYLRIR